MRLLEFLILAICAPVHGFLDSIFAKHQAQKTISDLSHIFSPPKNSKAQSQSKDDSGITGLKKKDSPASFLSKLHIPTSDAQEIQTLSLDILRVTKMLQSDRQQIPFLTPLLGALGLDLSQLQNLGPNDVRKLLRNYNVTLPKAKRETADFKSSSPCGESVRHRELDGTCNNLHQPCWGQATEAYSRWLPPDYKDGIGQPRARRNGSDLPNPRVLSIALNTGATSLTKLSSISLVWGQFIAHDISHTPTFVQILKDSNNEEEALLFPDCCGEDRHHPECFSISIEQDDSFFTKGYCLDFIRSSAYVFNPKGCEEPKLGYPREQINQVTPFIDASTIYGSSAEVMRSLRTNDGIGAQLKMTEIRNVPILSRDVSTCRSFSDECDSHCMLSGEIRASETPGLASLHTLWVREHNRIAQIFQSKGWDQETVFQETRKIIIAMIEHITFNEFLPQIIGPEMMVSSGLHTTLGGYEYDSSIDPRVLNSFASAAYRYGHSMAGEQMERLTGDFNLLHPLVKDLFTVDEFCDLTSDPLIRLLGGQAQQNSQNVDNIFSKDLTNHLFASGRDESGLDLLSFNIQRGRDHGLPSYNHWRERCEMSKAESFDSLHGEMPLEILLKLEKIYGHDSVDDMDLYVAGISENLLNEASVGPTFACIIAEQFRRLKYGDRFWYENLNHPRAFTDDQLLDVKKTTLSAVMCRNVQIFEIQKEVFRVASGSNPVVPCDQLMEDATLNTNLW